MKAISAPYTIKYKGRYYNPGETVNMIDVDAERFLLFEASPVKVAKVKEGHLKEPNELDKGNLLEEQNEPILNESKK